MSDRFSTPRQSLQSPEKAASPTMPLYVFCQEMLLRQSYEATVLRFGVKVLCVDYKGSK